LKERDDEEEKIQGVENNDIQNQELLNANSRTSIERHQHNKMKNSKDDSARDCR